MNGGGVGGTTFGPNEWLVDDMYDQYQGRPLIGQRQLAGVLHRLRGASDTGGSGLTVAEKPAPTRWRRLLRWEPRS